MKKIFYFILVSLLTLSIFAVNPKIKLQNAIKYLNSNNNSKALSEINDAVMDIENSMRLNIKHLTRVSKVNGFGDYIPISGFTLNEGEVLKLYFEVEGYHVAKKEGKYLLWLTEDIEITNDRGEKIFSRSGWLQLKQVFPYPLCPVFMTNTISSIPKGKYFFKITLHDMVANKKMEKTITITVK